MTRFCQVATLVLMMSGMPIAQSPDELIARLQQKYEALESFSADFEQMFQGGGVQLRESGIVKMKKPGKMYWEYQQPTPKLFIADGKKSYFYLPQDKQVIVSDLDLENASTPLLFLVGKGKIQEDFQVELEEVEKPLHGGLAVPVAIVGSGSVESPPHAAASSAPPSASGTSRAMMKKERLRLFIEHSP